MADSNSRALASPAPQPVAVKPLEWRPIGPKGGDIEAETTIGTYTISIDSGFAGRTHYLWVAGQGESEVHHSEHQGMGAAKAAAQADFDARIRSALASPAPTDEMVERLIHDERLEELVSRSTPTSAEIHDMAVELLAHRDAQDRAVRRPQPTDEMVEAAEAAHAWLESWAQHVGSCLGGNLCTCGLTAIRAQLEIALRSRTGEVKE